MGESFDHCPPGWIGQSRKRCTQSIHNHMVVDYLAMSSVDFAIHDFCLQIPMCQVLAGNFLAELHCGYTETPDEGAVPVPKKLTIEGMWGQIRGHPG
jgi:hypothetical protein